MAITEKNEANVSAKKSARGGWREFATRLAETPGRLMVTTRMAKTTGMFWEMKLPGLVEAIRVMSARAQSPANIYRIHAVNSPDRVAVRWRDQAVTFGALDARMDAVATGFRRAGIGRGSSVMLMMRNRPEFLETSGALSRLGASAVAVSWRSTPNELVYLANNCGAKAIVVESSLAHVVLEAAKSLPAITTKTIFVVGGEAHGATPYEELARKNETFTEEPGASEDAAVVIYTSGTTGKPKGAVRKFPRQAIPQVMRFLSETPLRVDDVHLVSCPMYHTTAYGFLTMSHLLGNTAVLLEDFKPETFLEHVERFRVTTSAMVPTMLHRVMALGEEALKRYDARSLRVIFTTGAPLPGPLSTAVMDHFGDIVFNLYESTETGMVTLAKPADLRAAPGTIGRVVPGNDIRLLDDKGNEVKTDHVGELYVKSPVLVTGYHNDAQATQDSMKDGYFSVGDLARKDRDGRYFIEGRKRDMVISGGVNVYPVEVESAIEQHPEVAEVAVIGVDDAEWGERVRAYVVKKPGSLLDDVTLKAWLRERLGGPKMPREFFFIDVLPRNPTGKVLKRELRAKSLS